MAEKQVEQGKDRDKNNTLTPRKHRNIDNFGDKRQSPWKPGQSGNPHGRPTKEHCLTSLIKEYLSQTDPNDTHKKKRTREATLAEAIAEMARKGHRVALKELLDRVDGPIRQIHEIRASVVVSRGELARELAAAMRDARALDTGDAHEPKGLPAGERTDETAHEPVRADGEDARKGKDEGAH